METLCNLTVCPRDTIFERTLRKFLHSELTEHVFSHTLGSTKILVRQNRDIITFISKRSKANFPVASYILDIICGYNLKKPHAAP